MEGGGGREREGGREGEGGGKVAKGERVNVQGAPSLYYVWLVYSVLISLQ